MESKNNLPISTFEQIISPLDITFFINNIWEKKSLHIQRRDPNYYHLLNLGEFEDLVLYGAPRRESHEAMASRIEPLHGKHEKYYLDCWETDYWSQTINVYTQGCALLLNHVEKRSKNVAILVKSIELFFGTYCWANAFLSPVEKVQNFPLHYDSLDIFILQTAGSKYWKVYKPQTELPHPGILSAAPSIGTLQIEFEGWLKPGDMLYVPRGFAHEVQAQDSEPAIHLTFSVEPCRWMDVMIESIQEWTSRELQARRSFLPLGKLAQSRQHLAKEFSELVNKFADQFDFSKTADRIEASIISKTVPLASQYFSMINREITLQTRCQVREDLLIVFRKEQQLNSQYLSILRFSGNILTIPDQYHFNVEFILKVRKFSPDQLPGVLAENERIGFVRQLVVQGLLIFADASNQ